MRSLSFGLATDWRTLSRLLLVVLGFSLLSFAAVARAQEAPDCRREADARDRYGDEITLYLVDHLDLPRIKLEIPVGMSLAIEGLGPEARKRGPISVCAAEPIATRFAYITFSHREAESLGLVDSLTIGRMVMRLFDVGAEEQYAHMAWVDSRPNTEQSTLSNGFTKYSAVRDRPFGTYILPAGGDVERPIYMSCVPAMGEAECSVSHQWDNGLNVTYWFDYDSVDPADWRLLDRTVRDAAEAMSSGGD